MLYLYLATSIKSNCIEIQDAIVVFYLSSLYEHVKYMPIVIAFSQLLSLHDMKWKL